METTPVYRIGGKGRPKGCRVPTKEEESSKEESFK